MKDRRQLRKQRLLVGGCIYAVAIVCFLAGLAPLAIVLIVGGGYLLSRRQGVPVMAYHSVSPEAEWLPWARNISVRPEIFARHMKTIQKSGWQVVSDRDLFQSINGQTILPKRSLVLHFDDAYLDVLHHAVPILVQHNFPAAVFASTDFVDPSRGVRALGEVTTIGYLNADELRHLDANPLFEIACHGKDHARLAVEGPSLPRDAPHVWGPETAFLWGLMPGDKSRWFESNPPNITSVPANDSALTATLIDESPEARLKRVTELLTQARQSLCGILGRDIGYMCWPFDRVTEGAVQAAKAAGFHEFTGGRADNVPASGHTSISRTHVNDFAAGIAPDWFESFVFRAKLEVAAGNLLWWPVAALANRRRKRAFPVLHGHLA